MNNTLLNNQQITEEIKKEIKICIETNENENTTTQNLWDTVKAVLRGKFIAIQAHLWQTLLLARWRPILAGLPFESIVVERQQEYRRVLAYIGESAKTTHFIEFILHCLLDTIKQEVKLKYMLSVSYYKTKRCN